MPTTIPTTTSSTRPGSPSAGDAYFETDTKSYIIYDGANWRGYVSDGIPFAKGSTSADFDGVDDYISVADADNLSFGDGSSDSPFSLAAWVKSDTSGGTRILVKGLGVDQEYAFTVSGGGVPGLSLYDADFNNRIQIESGTNITSGVWQHWAVTYDGSGSFSNGKIYLNGSAVSTTTASAGTYVAMHNTSVPLDIGRFNVTINGSNSESFTNGHLDDVAVIAKELSAPEVSAIWSSNSYPTELVSLWRFEGNANDSKGSNDGTNNGSTNLNSTDIRS
jgi:hypothetical protein